MKGKNWKTPFGWHINHLGKNKSSQILKKTSFKAHPAHGHMFSCNNVHPVHQFRRFFFTSNQTPSNSLILTTILPSGKNFPPTAVKSVQDIFSWGAKPADEEFAHTESDSGIEFQNLVPSSMSHVGEEDGRKISSSKSAHQEGIC